MGEYESLQPITFLLNLLTLVFIIAILTILRRRG